MVPTVSRMPRIHGLPPMTAGSSVIRFIAFMEIADWNGDDAINRSFSFYSAIGITSMPITIRMIARTTHWAAASTLRLAILTWIHYQLPRLSASISSRI